MVHIIFLTILAYFATRLSPIRNNLSGVMSMAQYHYPMQCFFFVFLIYYWYQLYKITKRKALVHISGICLIISLFMPFKRSSHDFFSECHTYAGFIGIVFVVITLAMILYDLHQTNTYLAYKLLQLLMSLCIMLTTVLCFLADITGLFEWLAFLSFIIFLEAYKRSI